VAPLHETESSERLERDPHRFLEGMLVAAYAVGVGACYIYLRDEYHGARALLEAELAKLQANPPCPLPLIELRRGAGAYICGEESAMIESIEGKRGEPRMRPPYIAQVGLFGRPTLEHNFETLYWVRDIVEKGASWFSSFGANGRKGLRSFSVSGRVKHPGVKLAPAGITIRELIDQYCGGMLEGHELKVLGPMQGDHVHATALYAPSIDALFAGDLLFNEMYLWLGEHGRKETRAWGEAVDDLAALEPEIVVPGHAKPGMPNDASSLAYTAGFIDFWLDATRKAKNSEELRAMVEAAYPDSIDVLDGFLLVNSSKVAMGEEPRWEE
ncbi:SLBB domain-containing protein, partial [Hyphococcus sp.]|uniref:SLBB domain-containing protein n=1 Tax=Hyphococcus sp. TaxID=2038636 RepID=UPI0035C67A2E